MSKKKHALKRVFKTSWFTKAAKKARIQDVDLCIAIQQVMQGQAIDLGGGVFKKRLDKNRYRSIILARAGQYWVYEFLFAKKDLDNIEDGELNDFRALAKIYAELSAEQIGQLLEKESLVEICHDSET
jgi:hypothetical protein